MIDLKAAEADVITWATGPKKELALELIAEIEQLRETPVEKEILWREGDIELRFESRTAGRKILKGDKCLRIEYILNLELLKMARLPKDNIEHQIKLMVYKIHDVARRELQEEGLLPKEEER